MHVSMCALLGQSYHVPQERTLSQLGAAPYDRWKPRNLGPLQQWYVFLTTEPALQPRQELPKAKHCGLLNEIPVVVAPSLLSSLRFNRKIVLSLALLPWGNCGLLLIS